MMTLLKMVARGKVEQMSDEIKVWQMNDCDWYAGRTLEECQKAYMALTKQSAESLFFEDGKVEPLSDIAMEMMWFTDEDGTVRSFRQELNRLIDAGTEFPEFFASTEQ